MRVYSLTVLSLFAVSFFVVGTVQAQPSCSVTLALRIPSTVQIFSIQQERALGDIEADLVENSYHAAKEKEFVAHLDAIAARVLSKFPSDHVPVHVILLDTPEANSFSVGPERIYITRKMVALLRNDDELAGLLGHELGHVLAHQNSLIVSQLFHEILGVNAVGNQKDILEKLRRVLDGIDRDPKLLRKTAAIMEKQERFHQAEADRVALQASAAAGFSPEAYLRLFQRSEGTTRSSGIAPSIYSSATTSKLSRLREIQKTLRQLPQPCREVVPSDSAGFLAWQAGVITEPNLARRSSMSTP
jgi:predicted Zn-dependent protease